MWREWSISSVLVLMTSSYCDLHNKYPGSLLTARKLYFLMREKSKKFRFSSSSPRHPPLALIYTIPATTPPSLLLCFQKVQGLRSIQGQMRYPLGIGFCIHPWANAQRTKLGSPKVRALRGRQTSSVLSIVANNSQNLAKNYQSGFFLNTSIFEI